MSQDTDVTKALTENIPTSVNDVVLGDERGILSAIGDPLGKVLYNVLSPVGALIGGTGDRMAGFTNQGGGDGDGDGEAKKEEEYKKLGGNEQNGQNPLGL